MMFRILLMLNKSMVAKVSINQMIFLKLKNPTMNLIMINRIMAIDSLKEFNIEITVDHSGTFTATVDVSLVNDDVKEIYVR